MNKYWRHRTILMVALCTIVSGKSRSQSTFTSGFLPEINLIFPLSERVKLRSAVEAREAFFTNNRDNQWDYEHILTDFSAIASVKVGAGNAINGGYLLRLRDGKVFHRFIQQYRFVTNFSTLRLGHRVGVDQTFNGSEVFVFRSRYRLTLEKALNGTRIDPKEFYLKVAHEYLWIMSDGDSDLEIRLVPVLGYEISPGQGIETGVDYRVVVTVDDPLNALRLSITYFKTFGLK